MPAQLEATRFGCRSLQLQRLGGEGSGRNRLRYLDTVARVNTCQLSVGGIVVTVGPWQQRDFVADEQWAATPLRSAAAHPIWRLARGSAWL